MSAVIETRPDSPDTGVALHYGDPLGEQRAAASGPVLIDRSHRDVVGITGTDRLSWLEGFVSQHVSELREGEAAETLILDAQGRVEHHLLLAEQGESLLIDTEAGRGAPLVDFLTKMVFWADAHPAAADYVVLTLAGAELPELINAPDGCSIQLPQPSVHPYDVVKLPGGGVARALPWPGLGSIDLILPREAQSAWWEMFTASGIPPAGTWAYDALRVGGSTTSGEIHDGQLPVPLRARIGLDTDARTIPHEIPSWIGSTAEGGAVHISKGCYRGQETVSRVHNLGRSPRVLVRLQLDGSTNALPSPGADVLAAGRPVGTLGTVVHHHEEGPVALALLKRSVTAVTELTVDGVAATIDPDTVPSESAPQAGREAVRRLRGM